MLICCLVLVGLLSLIPVVCLVGSALWFRMGC